MTDKFFKTSAVGVAVAMMAIGGPAIAKSEKGKPLSTVASKKDETVASANYPGNSGNAPGRCVSEIAKPHSGYGINDEKKEECGQPPVSK